MICVQVYYTTNYRRGACRPRRRQNKNLCFPGAAISSFPPQENIWLWLRQSLEKAARSGDQISESSILVAIYAKARTHFEHKS